MAEEKIIEIQNKKYNLSKLKDEELLVLQEYMIKRGNYLVKKIEEGIR